MNSLGPYRSPPEEEKKVYRPRTWIGKLRSIRRKFLVWKRGTWKKRFERCEICGEANVRMPYYCFDPILWDRYLKHYQKEHPGHATTKMLVEEMFKCYTNDNGPW